MAVAFMEGDRTRWEPLGQADLAVIGVVICVDSAVGLLVIHVAHRWSWSPYAAKVPLLAVTTGVAAMLSSLAITMRYGIWGEAGKSKPPLGCVGEAFFLWISAGSLFGSVFVRLYRQHSVLIKHTCCMWSPPFQLCVVQLPIILPLLVYLFMGDSFDPETQECQPDSAWPESFGLAVLVLLALGSTAITWRLRPAYCQAKEEFEAAVVTSAVLLLCVIILPACHVGLENDLVSRRRAMLVTVAVAGAVLFLHPLLRPLIGFWNDDENYKASREYGFEQNKCPALVKQRFEHQRQIDNRCASAKEQKSPSGVAMDKFYRETLDREEMGDYFLRQACTIRILHTYVREGAPEPVPLSDECRSLMLATEASSMYIFQRARDEVLEKMGGQKVSVELPMHSRGPFASSEAWTQGVNQEATSDCRETAGPICESNSVSGNSKVSTAPIVTAQKGSTAEKRFVLSNGSSTDVSRGAGEYEPSPLGYNSKRPAPTEEKDRARKREKVANSKKSSGVEKKANKKKRKGAAGHKIMPRLRTAPDTLFLNDKEQNGDVESNSTTPEETVNQNPFFGRTAAIGGENNSALGDKRNDAAAATAPDGDKNNEVQTAAPPSLFTKSLLAGRRLHLGGTKRASSFGFDSPGTNGRSSLNNAAAAAAAGSKNNELQAGALPSLFTMSLLAGRRLHSGGTERASSVVFDSPGTSGRSRLNNSQSFGRLLTRVDDVSAAFGLSYGADSDEDDDSDEGDDSDEDDDDQWDEERGTSTTKSNDGAKHSGLGDKAGGDLAVAAAMIANPIFGDTSRTVGRQGRSTDTVVKAAAER